MRLLKITNVGSDGKVDFELVSVYRPVPYAILSHTWDPDPDKEYLFDDARHATGETKPGYKKVQGFLAAAWNHRPRLEYGWVDTCCIDKSSSAELSEAINSMFQWYMDARVCLAYLADYDQVLSPDDRVSTNILGTCRWLTRGWTLQELLAPPSLIFYSADWQAIGTRSGLRDVVSKATGIHQSALKGDISAIRSFSIAQRMSWAATRDTTRLEDMAYCLLGIFDVNMPLLYGEGQRAFLRLQEEIIKDSDDQTIFCWHGRAGNEPDGEYSFFASHPSRFAYCQTIVPIHTGRVHTYQLTNAGLRVTARLQETKRRCRLLLHCRDERSSHEFLKLHVKRVSPDSNQLVRVAPDLYDDISDDWPEVEVYLCKRIPRNPPALTTGAKVEIKLVDYALLDYLGMTWSVVGAYPPDRWNGAKKIFSASDLQTKTESLTGFSWHVTAEYGIVWDRNTQTATYLLDVGFNGFSATAWCNVREPPPGSRHAEIDLQQQWKRCPGGPGTRNQQVSKIKMTGRRTLCFTLKRCNNKDGDSGDVPRFELEVDIEHSQEEKTVLKG